MKMNKVKRYVNALFLTLCFTLFFAIADVQAAYNDPVIPSPMGIYATLNTGMDTGSVSLHLERNKKNRNDPYTLEIDPGGTGIARISNISNVSLNDINSKDKYIEIVTCSTPKKRLTIYRWNGKKPVVYASAVLTSELAKLSKKNYCYAPGNYVLGCEGDGKGHLTVKVAMVIQGLPCILDLRYKVENGTIRFDNSSYGVIDKGVKLKETQNSKAWHVYKYPIVELSRNKEVFTLKKGEKIRTLKLKITPQYTFMQVKRIKDNKVGWVPFRIKDIDSGNRNYNPYK